MATEVEYVNYKDFVADLESTENPGVDDVTVVSNGTDGPRTVPANTSALTNTATDSDLTDAASFELQTATGKKKVPANLLAKQSAFETTNGNVTALTTYAQNVSASVAPEYVPANGAKVGKLYMYEGVLSLCKENASGAWDGSKFVTGSLSLLAPLSLSKEFDVTGANLTARDIYFPVSQGIGEVIVKPTPVPWPTDTVGGSNPAILIIYGIDTDGLETALKQYYVGSTVPEAIYVTVPEGTVILHFFVRANNNEKVNFTVINGAVEQLHGLEDAIENESQRLTASNIAIEDLNVGAFGSKVDIAGKGATEVQSNAYKVVGLSTFTVDFSSNESWPVTQLSDNTNKFWLQVYYNNLWNTLVQSSKSSTMTKWSVEIPINATKLRFFTRCNTGTTLTCTVSSVAVATTFTLTGKGSTSVNKYIRVKPSTDYYLIADKSWSTAGLSTSSTVLNIYASNENLVEGTRLVQTQVPTLPAMDYRFRTPDDCSIIKILFRGETNVSVLFNLSESYESPINKDKYSNLSSIKRYNGYTLPSVLLMGDPHSDNIAYRDYLRILNTRYNTIDAIIVLGDMAHDNPSESGTFNNFKSFVNSSSRPVLPVIGNHDIGSGWGLNTYQSVADAVSNLMADAVVRGFIPSAPNGYYYVDMGSAWNYKVRFIVLNNYNVPGVYDNESLWERVEYDSDAPAIALNTSYSQGDVVNVGSWTDCSYKATQSLTTPSAQPTSKVHNFPCWSTRPDSAKLDAVQAQWLLDTMATTPAYTGIVIVQHSTLATSCTKDLANKFTQKDGPSLSTSSVGDFLVEAAKAFEDKSASFSYTVRDETVSKDFSSRSSSASFVGFIGGHEHHDYIVRSVTYPKYYEVAANKSMLSYAGDNSDIFTQSSYPSATYCAINRETKSMVLAKIGVQYTQGGYARDIDVVRQEAPAN